MVNKLLKDIHSNQIGIIVIARFEAGWKINSDSPKDDSAELKFWLGKSYLKIRKWDKAVKEMEKVVKMEPSNALVGWLLHDRRRYAGGADKAVPQSLNFAVFTNRVLLTKVTCKFRFES